MSMLGPCLSLDPAPHSHRQRLFPRLPADRPRPLTPPGFRTQLEKPEKPANGAAPEENGGAPVQRQLDSKLEHLQLEVQAEEEEGLPRPQFQHHAAFFRLPPDIRRDILCRAFGGRRVHMHLSYGYPDAPGRDETHHCGVPNVDSERYYQRKERIADVKKDKSWRWWSSVCHRLPSDTPPGLPMTSSSGVAGPWMDQCFAGEAEHCEGLAPDGCFIGIMGWLLSCRQNYAEGIDVLYSTNTIAMTGEDMLANLPQLVLPQRLASVTSLEVRWRLKSALPEYEIARDELDEDYLETLLRLLSTHFPALRRLHISLEGLDRPTITPHYEGLYIDALHRHLDPFAQRASSALIEFAVALPRIIFDKIYRDAREVIVEDYGGHWYRESFRQVWRNLDGQTCLVRPPFLDSYPAAPYHLEQDGTRDTPGYWILEGAKKKPRERSPPRRTCGFSQRRRRNWGMVVVPPPPSNPESANESSGSVDTN